MSTLKSSAEDLTLNADGSGNDIKFQSNGVEKASIDQDGLVTCAGATMSGNIAFNSDGIVSSTAGFMQLSAEDSMYLNYDTDNGGGEAFNIRKGTTARFTIDNAGDVAISAGDLIFGTAGKGICLGVTSNTDSNTLDDYEEGTWTPQIYGSVTGTGTTVDGQGEYVKIGRMVNVTGEVNPFTDAEIDGGLMFQNLPFARSTVGTPDWTTFQPMVLYGMDTMGSGFQYLYFHGSTGGTFKETKDGIASVTLDTDDISSSLNLSAVKFSFSYPT